MRSVRGCQAKLSGKGSSHANSRFQPWLLEAVTKDCLATFDGAWQNRQYQDMPRCLCKQLQTKGPVHSHPFTAALLKAEYPGSTQMVAILSPTGWRKSSVCNWNKSSKTKQSKLYRPPLDLCPCTALSAFELWEALGKTGSIESCSPPFQLV